MDRGIFVLTVITALFVVANAQYPSGAGPRDPMVMELPARGE